MWSLEKVYVTRASAISRILGIKKILVDKNDGPESSLYGIASIFSDEGSGN